jgi:hypothetical protein
MQRESLFERLQPRALHLGRQQNGDIIPAVVAQSAAVIAVPEVRFVAEQEQRPRTFYRLVKANPPTERDFWSYEKLDIRLTQKKPTARQIRSWRSCSTYVTEDQARMRELANRAAGGRSLGDFIAVLEIQPDSGIECGEVNSNGHCDLLGAPDVLLASVVAVVRV